MHIHFHTDAKLGDIVTLDDGLRLRWSHWLTTTERAVHSIRTVLDTPRLVRTEEQVVAAMAGRRWLARCGVLTLDRFLDLEKHLPLLRLPPDPARSRKCRRCGAPIWGRLALLTGLGSECRRGRTGRAATTRRTHRRVREAA